MEDTVVADMTISSFILSFVNHAKALVNSI